MEIQLGYLLPCELDVSRFSFSVRRYNFFVRNLISRFTFEMPGDKKGGGGDENERSRSRSRSPLRPENSGSSFLSVEEMKSMMGDVLKASLPKIIIEASKVAREGLVADNETTRKMAKDMRLLKQNQEEIAQVSKAALLKSEGLFFLMIQQIVGNE